MEETTQQAAPQQHPAEEPRGLDSRDTGETAEAGSSSSPGLASFANADVKYFVGGFHSDVTEDEVREHFSCYGTVADVQIMRDAASGRSRGFGFVTMADPNSKATILAEKDHIIGGRKASVRPYTEQADVKDSFTDGPILKRKIFVGGVNPALGHEVLEKYFGNYGPLENATIMRYPDGRSRGFGFVVFRDETACQQVLQQRHHYITQRDRVEVKPCLSREKSRAAAGMSEPQYGMRPVHPYGGYYGASAGGAAYGGGAYGGAYGQYYNTAAGYGTPMPGGTTSGWADYRDGWNPYDAYGSYYGWQGGYPTATPQQQGPYGPSAGVPRSTGLTSGVAQPPPSARGPATDGGYYHMGGTTSMGAASYPYSHMMSGGTATTGAGGMGSVSTSASTMAHPGYGAMRRGTGAMPPTTAGGTNVSYGGMARGRVTPY